MAQFDTEQFDEPQWDGPPNTNGTVPDMGDGFVTVSLTVLQHPICELTVLR